MTVLSDCFPFPSLPRDEESKLEQYIKSISDAGVKVILSGGAIGEMAMHFIEKVGGGG